ncbi:unnamed protein product [Clonostachys byssicola]|uniref:Uncharacterized protein n=1 Tax=Clonostachys byssicola TaxID=160290 RepID=A0A9N9U9G3_9HYPO|nr:unnamed protein product [Clonostachys byssicola]
MVAYKTFGLAVTVVFGIAGTAMAEPRDSSNVAFLEARNVDYVGSIDLERRDRKGAAGALAQNSAQLANSMGRSSKAGPNGAVASLAKNSARAANADTPALIRAEIFLIPDSDYGLLEGIKISNICLLLCSLDQV